MSLERFILWSKYRFMQSADSPMMRVMSDIRGELMSPFMLNLWGMVVFSKVYSMSAKALGSIVCVKARPRIVFP